MNFNTYADREILTLAVANEIATTLKTQLQSQEQASIALAGGTTPGPIFDELCAVEMDWSSVSVMASDERWVPQGHERSNAKLIRERLLVQNAAAANFIPFFREGHTPETAAEELCSVVKPYRPLTVALLGMGEDMHTASLFPGTSGLAEALHDAAPEVMVLRPDSQPEVRMSLSAPVLNGALAKHLVIFGEAKKDALERALTLSPQEAPISAVLHETQVHWAP